MKFNQWTLGLAAVGAVSLASAVRADEAKLSALQTALSNTTISGYVDVQASFIAGNQAERTSYYYGGNYYYNGYISQDNRDQFQLNAVTVSLDKPQDESPWASGYHVDLNAGSAAIQGISLGNNYGYYSGNANVNPNNVAVRQAYIALRTPVGNGIDWKIGVMDGITGYEGNTGYLNPNVTRSFAYSINPASYTGIVGTYKISDLISVTGGFINRTDSQGYNQANWNLTSHDYVASASLTAPNSWGFLKGSSLNIQTIQGFDNQAVNNYSVNGTLNTPVAGLKVGFAWDAINSLAYSADGNVYGIYATYQATDKLSFALRGEYIDSTDTGFSVPNTVYNNSDTIYGKGQEISLTATYNLWANVVTRAEFRWDHQEHGTTFSTANENAESQYSFIVNAIYKF